MRFFLFFFLIFPFGNSQETPDDYYIPSIKVYDGLFRNGEQAIILSPEGLIIRRSCINCNNYKRKVRFFRVDQLDSEKIEKLLDFLQRVNNFKQFRSKYLTEGNGLIVPRRYIIGDAKDNCKKQILDSDFSGNFNASYKEDRVKMDSLLILMNDIIPKKYVDKYSIKVFDN